MSLLEEWYEINRKNGFNRDQFYPRRIRNLRVIVNRWKVIAFDFISFPYTFYA